MCMNESIKNITNLDINYKILYNIYYMNFDIKILITINIILIVVRIHGATSIFQL